MLENNLTIPKEEAKVYPPLPKNVYQVELLDITLKDATGKFAKEGDKNFNFQFTLLSGLDGENDLRGRSVWASFVPTALYFGGKGKNELYQIVEAYLGRDLTQEEEANGLTGEFLNSFIGKQIKVFIDHKPSKNDPSKIYNNITSYMPSEVPLNSLTAEEKEMARVKNKDEKTPAEQMQSGIDASQAPLPEAPQKDVSLGILPEEADGSLSVDKIPF